MNVSLRLMLKIIKEILITLMIEIRSVLPNLKKPKL